MGFKDRMTLFKYVCIQFVFFSVIILANFYLDGWISHPFTYVDLLAIILGFVAFTLILPLYVKVIKQLQPIHLVSKSFIVLFVFMLAVTMIGFFTGQLIFYD